MRNKKRHYLIALGSGLLLCGGALPVFAANAPSLGDAQTFAILAGSTVTDAGASIVTGNVGVSPGTSISGFPPGTISGTQHKNDTAAQNAQLALTSAYNDLTQTCTSTLTSDLGGMTLTPGVYCFTSTAQLTGTLHLDPLGDRNAVFIFRITSALTTGTGAKVVLTTGNIDCNVFWQVGSSATLGTGTDFMGNILAGTSITLVDGASSTGSLLARSGAVTVDSGAISVCAESTPVTLQSFMVD